MSTIIDAVSAAASVLTGWGWVVYFAVCGLVTLGSLAITSLTKKGNRHG